VILFDITQILYAIANIGYDALYVKKSSIICKKEPKTYVTINSLIALYHEPISIIRDNVISQLNTNYPKEKLNIFLIAEQKDDQTIKNAQKVSKEFGNVHVIVIPPNGDKDWPEVIKKWKNNTMTDLPFGKGRALIYAYYSELSEVRNAEVIAIFDAEDIVDPCLFKYAVAGLEDGYDIVQGKLKYRNGSKNILTALEASEPVIWSNLIYPHTTHPNVPYQVLGPAYFFKSNLPGEIGGWSPFTTSEDVDFGFKAWSSGKRLAILDIYTSELGVETIGSWFKQRRRWARGHQKAIFSDYLLGHTKWKTIKNRLNFWTYSLNSQLMSVIGVIGVPTGIYQIQQTITGHSDKLGYMITIISIFNLLHWLFASYSVMNATKAVYKFNRKQDELLFYARVNPITTLFYSMLWFIPIMMAILDCIGRKQIEWEHTPREGEPEILDASAFMQKEFALS
jgi:cellulose synthase/poly-beta-1,6-N-acetylglucosamine synthase-like glycosyltransferase